MFLKLHYSDDDATIYINVNSISVIDEIPNKYGTRIKVGKYDFFVREGIDEIENMLAAVSEFKSNN